jgi:hypothetical protein
MPLAIQIDYQLFKVKKSLTNFITTWKVWILKLVKQIELFKNGKKTLVEKITSKVHAR